VILCTRRRPEALSRCLASLQQLRYPDVSILVIENDVASTEAEVIAISYDAEYRLCTRQGLSAARNFGVRLSSSELLAFIDDDATCEPDWLVSAASLFADPLVQAVTGTIEFHSGMEPLHVFDPGDHTVNRSTPDWFGMANFGGLGLGSNFIVRRSAFDLVGGFDERLGRGAPLHSSEENDFLFRVIDAGYSVATCSESVVRHPSDVSAAERDIFRSISASTVMVAMLAVEHPRHIFKLARYLLGAVTRKPQSWRERPTQLFDGIASRWTIYSALLAGPFMYLDVSLRHAIHGTPHHAETTTPSLVSIAARANPVDVPESGLRTHIS